jgi:hypothetical protein
LYLYIATTFKKENAMKKFNQALNKMNSKGFIMLTSAFIFPTLFSFTNQTAVLQSDEIRDILSKYEYRSIKNKAFDHGEKLEFRVHYGIINAAKITAEVMPKKELFERPQESKGRQAYHIVAQGQTLKAFDWAFKVRDRFDSWVDEESLCPLKYTKSVEENNYRDQDLVYFRHPSQKLNGKKGNMDIPEYTQDIVSSLYYARNLDLANAKKGDMFPIDIYLDNKIYNLHFRFDGIEIIKSDVGRVRCYKLIPRLVVDRVFKGEEDMTVWVTADDNKIPVRVKSDIQVGSLKVDLTSYSGLRNPFTALVTK